MLFFYIVCKLIWSLEGGGGGEGGYGGLLGKRTKMKAYGQKTYEKVERKDGKIAPKMPLFKFVSHLKMFLAEKWILCLLLITVYKSMLLY